jgi:hypothetical protein
LRINVFIAAGLLITAGSLFSDPGSVTASRALGIAGYFNFLGILILLICLTIYLRRCRDEISATDYVVSSFPSTPDEIHALLRTIQL